MGKWEPPLTREVVHAIERHQVMPAEPRLVQAYLRQLVKTIAWRLYLVRAELPTPRLLAIGPQFAPVLLFAHSSLWRELLHQLEERGDVEAVRVARDRVMELYRLELSLPELIDPDRVEALRRDFWQHQVFGMYARWLG